MCANVEWKSGIQTSISVTFAGNKNKWELQVIGTDDTLLVKRSGLGYIVKLECESDEGTFFPFEGTKMEFAAFAKACQEMDRSADRNIPEEAFNDLAFVYACLDSGMKNGEPQRLQKI